MTVAALTEELINDACKMQKYDRVHLKSIFQPLKNIMGGASTLSVGDLLATVDFFKVQAL